MHGELAICGGCAGDASQGIFTTARAELLVHVFGGEEAAMATLNKGSQMLDSLKSGSRQKVKIHLKENILALSSALEIILQIRVSTLTAKSVVMVATCMVLTSVLADAAPPASSRASRFL